MLRGGLHGPEPFRSERRENDTDENQSRNVADQVAVLRAALTAWKAMMPACTQLDHTVNQIKLRFSRGLFDARIKKMPSVA